MFVISIEPLLIISQRSYLTLYPYGNSGCYVTLNSRNLALLLACKHVFLFSLSMILLTNEKNGIRILPLSSWLFISFLENLNSKDKVVCNSAGVVTTSNSLFSVIHHSRSQVSKTKIYFSFLISTCLLVGFTVNRLSKHLSVKNWEKILSNEGASLQRVWRHAPTEHFEILRLEIWNVLGEQFLSRVLGQLLAICTIIRVKCNLNLVTKVLWQF